MRKHIVLVAVAFLTGCATPEGYKKSLDIWIGDTEENLVRKWGPPKKISVVEGRRLLVYSRSRILNVPSSGPAYASVGGKVQPVPFSGIPASAMSLSCETTFEVANEKVIAYQFQGNDCQAL